MYSDVKLNKLINFIYGFSQRPFNRPTRRDNSLVKSFVGDSGLFFPPLQRKSLSIKRNDNTVSPIIILNLISRPSAIFFAIVSIVIKSINRCLFFSKFLYMRLVTLIHIIFEICKRFPQALYSMTTIFSKRPVISIKTTSFDTSPDMTKSGFVHSVTDICFHNFNRQNAGRFTSILHFSREANNGIILS